LFNGKVIRDFNGIEQTIDYALAQTIYEGLIINGYIKQGILTDKYYDDKKSGTINFAEEVKGLENSIISIIDTIYDAKACEA